MFKINRFIYNSANF